MPHESFKDTIKDCITWIRLCLKLLCHNKFICHISRLIWWIITWILGASSFRPLFVHSARKVKPVHVIVSLFRILQIPRFFLFFFNPFFRQRPLETGSQTGDWQSDWTPGEVFTLRQNLAGSPSWLCHYSCEASGKSVAASNGHRWRSVTSQVMCEYLVSLLHSFKGTKSTLQCTVAWQHKMLMRSWMAKLYSWTCFHNKTLKSEWIPFAYLHLRLWHFKSSHSHDE